MSRYSAETEGAFSWIDYLLFGAFLCISLCVGIYHAWRAWQNRYAFNWIVRTPTGTFCRKIRHQLSNASRLLYQGDGEMPIVPIALSLLTTFLSGVTMLGTPAEIYRRGALGYSHFYVLHIVQVFTFGCTTLWAAPHSPSAVSSFCRSSTNCRRSASMSTLSGALVGAYIAEEENQYFLQTVNCCDYWPHCYSRLTVVFIWLLCYTVQRQHWPK